MQSNTRRDTQPERVLRSALHRRGLRFRVDLPIALLGRRPVRPDIVFTRSRLAIFVDGCFWHGCPDHFAAPRSNLTYWEPKIARNIERDGEVTAALLASGWRVIRIWEHEPAPAATVAVLEVLAERTHPGYTPCVATPPFGQARCASEEPDSTRISTFRVAPDWVSGRV